MFKYALVCAFILVQITYAQIGTKPVSFSNGVLNTSSIESFSYHLTDEANIPVIITRIKVDVDSTISHITLYNAHYEQGWFSGVGVALYKSVGGNMIQLTSFNVTTSEPLKYNPHLLPHDNSLFSFKLLEPVKVNSKDTVFATVFTYSSLGFWRLAFIPTNAKGTYPGHCNAPAGLTKILINIAYPAVPLLISCTSMTTPSSMPWMRLDGYVTA